MAVKTPKGAILYFRDTPTDTKHNNRAIHQSVIKYPCPIFLFFDKKKNIYI